MIQAAVATSIYDETPEGQSILELAANMKSIWREEDYEAGKVIPFTAESRMSGLLLGDVTYYKGAVEEIASHIERQGGARSSGALLISEEIAKEGGTPLAVCRGNQLLGIIYLKDIIKPGLREKFEDLRKMGIKTIMCTGIISLQPKR